MRNFVANQYEEHFVKHFNKILAEGQQEIFFKSPQFFLDLCLGDIDIRPYQDFTNQASSIASGESEDLALSRFLEGALTFTHVLGKVIIPLYCFTFKK